MTAEEAIAAGTATPETADGEETAVPETVEVQSKKNDTVHTYLKDNTTPIYWDYPLEDADFGNADYRVFLAGKTADSRRTLPCARRCSSTCTNSRG